MKKLTVTDTLDLSIPERIQLVADIWGSIAAKADAIELTEIVYLFEKEKVIVLAVIHIRRNPIWTTLRNR
jgi:hypothetical protein